VSEERGGDATFGGGEKLRGRCQLKFFFSKKKKAYKRKNTTRKREEEKRGSGAILFNTHSRKKRKNTTCIGVAERTAGKKVKRRRVFLKIKTDKRPGRKKKTFRGSSCSPPC